MSNWYCPNCGELESVNVTFEECCDICGHVLDKDENVKECLTHGVFGNQTGCCPQCLQEQITRAEKLQRENEELIKFQVNPYWIERIIDIYQNGDENQEPEDIYRQLEEEAKNDE